ncbi:hypothetical protein [Oceanobacillus halophilus]|uniref:Uncharacterized protein n=1 Tax=Oceanobacillus halophilus TaxID=930130 RepID=A0A495ACD1_9BACI|nr:hypothetical protein [Oceanobacillus halophilus]RKQ37631.1 hypothetical protein D8M06_02170 [Oceanobacillus halophilus]
MSVAMKKMEAYLDGVNKKQFEASLHEISDQIRIMDQKLIMKTENEIALRYNNQQYEINNVRDTLNNLRK